MRANGFTPLTATDANEAIEMMQVYEFDWLLLDLGWPGKDGLTFLEELRGQGETLPIIIFSARSDITHKVIGLEGGNLVLDLRTRQAKVGDRLVDLSAR